VIVGIGTDMVEIARIATALARHGDRFRRRVLTESELRAFTDPVAEARWFAKRYAAKEAVAKAFGTGIGEQLSFQNIIVGREPSGRPLLSFVHAGALLAQEKGITRAHLSLTDEREFALAFVVLEG
jgi:holo-[acyl-carrier protein] synthase